MLLINNIIVPLKAQFLNFAIYPAIRLLISWLLLASALGAMLVLSGGITIGFLSVFAIYQPNF